MASLVQPIFVMMIIMFVFVFIYGFFMHDEYDDDDEVTITFNCTQVLGAQNQYPDFVINECKKVRKR
jgi:uncharacterized membrane protein